MGERYLRNADVRWTQEAIDTPIPASTRSLWHYTRTPPHLLWETGIFERAYVSVVLA